MRVIVAGGSDWSDVEVIRRELSLLPSGATVIHGDSAGADAIAGQVATELGMTVEAWKKEPGDYQRYKRGAWKGLNERMLASGADLVLAFHHDLAKSRGTKHLVAIAKKAGVTVRVISE